MPCWLARVVFPVRHPRMWLCDTGVWKCDTHPRMMWLASDRRWALRHRLRARRVARLTGWAPGELRGHIDRERALLLSRLADDLTLVVDMALTRAWINECRRGVGLDPLPSIVRDDPTARALVRGLQESMLAGFARDYDTLLGGES